MDYAGIIRRGLGWGVFKLSDIVEVDEGMRGGGGVRKATKLNEGGGGWLGG